MTRSQWRTWQAQTVDLLAALVGIVIWLVPWWAGHGRRIIDRPTPSPGCMGRIRNRNILPN